MLVTINEARTNFSKLIAAVEAGEELVIARRNKPIVRMSKEVKEAMKPVSKRSLGFGSGKGIFSDEAINYLTENPDLDAEIEEDFEKSAVAE